MRGGGGFLQHFALDPRFPLSSIVLRQVNFHVRKLRLFSVIAKPTCKVAASVWISLKSTF